MKNLFRVLLVIVYGLVLTACMNTNNDGNQTENNKQIQTPDVQTEKDNTSDEQKENDPDEDTNQDENEEQKPGKSESPEESDVSIQNEAF